MTSPNLQSPCEAANQKLAVLTCEFTTWLFGHQIFGHVDEASVTVGVEVG